MAGKKKTTGAVSGQMELHDKVKHLQAEVDRLRALTAPGLLKDAEHALNWALGHPDYLPGGKHHDGALGTAHPVLRALQAANASAAKQVAKPPDAVPADEEPKPQGDAGENQAGG